MLKNTLGTLSTLETASGPLGYFRLPSLAKQGFNNVANLPFSIKILIESLLRNCDDYLISEQDVTALANYNPNQPSEKEFAFLPARVLMQDFTGVPAIVDLAAMRDAMHRLGSNPKRINPLIPVDLVIDHSIQVDRFGTSDALQFNTMKEFERNQERYQFLKWGQQSFQNFRVVPPATGIVHQVNLEYLADVVTVREIKGQNLAFPDTVVGTDSHTTMINGLGVVGWGVGGIEAEAVMLGQPIYMLPPKVVGFKLFGELAEGVTATDLVLHITEILRRHGVVDKFVEFFGPGLKHISLADRATVANMAPEYGATIGYFPIDQETLNYLKNTGRSDKCELVERYAKLQGIFLEDNTPPPLFSEILELDLKTVVPAVAGPKRPQDRIPLTQVPAKFQQALTAPLEKQGYNLSAADLNKKIALSSESAKYLSHGSIVIAAITSCTNTSNPSVMIAAGLLAKKAVAKGLTVPRYIKTSLAPGSKVVSKYLEDSALMTYLEHLGFSVVGYGCTTCIGNSGPLSDDVTKAIKEENLIVAAVLSGNRNFEGRVHALTKANFLASPPLVIAYALAGTINIDFETQPLGQDQQGNDIYLRDIWPTPAEIIETMGRTLKPQLFTQEYQDVTAGSQEWNQIPVALSDLYPWNKESTYIQEPPYFINLATAPKSIQPIINARVLVIAGHSVTTDHISPAGGISASTPAGQYLIEKGIPPTNFNQYGARRGDHNVMMRGTFANPRFRNLLTDKEGSFTVHFPDNTEMSIYDAAIKYQNEKIPTIIIAGKDYGMGSSRDWAAKGPALLGVQAVIFETVERIHRSNLIGMGILPLQFLEGENLTTLGLTGRETYHILGLTDNLKANSEITILAQNDNSQETRFHMRVRLDTPIEVDYYRNKGILPYVLRQLLQENTATVKT